jgi:hypothetical protein
LRTSRASPPRRLHEALGRQKGHPKMRVSGQVRARLKRAKAINSGGDLNDSTVTLCLYSPTINISKLSATLGCVPSHALAKAQMRHPPHGSGPSPVGLWLLEAPKPLRFEEKLRYLLGATPKRTSTWRRLSKSHDVQLRCGIFLHSWNEGFDLPADMLAEIGARGWKLGVSIYSAEGNEIVEAFLTKTPQARGR